jgi:hypothetical protein
VCADEAKQLQSTRFRDNFEGGKLQPVGWRVEHLRIADPERIILRPMTLNPFSPYIQQQTQLEVELGMLMLKKAEISVQVEELEYDMAFWVKLYNDIRGQQKRWGIQSLRYTSDNISTIRRKEVSIESMLKRDNEERDEKHHDSGVGMEETVGE